MQKARGDRSHRPRRTSPRRRPIAQRRSVHRLHDSATKPDARVEVLYPVLAPAQFFVKPVINMIDDVATPAGPGGGGELLDFWRLWGVSKSLAGAGTPHEDSVERARERSERANVSASLLKRAATLGLSGRVTPPDARSPSRQRFVVESRSPSAFPWSRAGVMEPKFMSLGVDRNKLAVAPGAGACVHRRRLVDSRCSPSP